MHLSTLPALSARNFVEVSSLELCDKKHLHNFAHCNFEFPVLQKLVLNIRPHQFEAYALPKNAQMPLLEDLEINGYDLSAGIPDWIKNAGSLKRLVLTNCNLQHFPDFILSLEKLEILDLGYNPLTDFPDALFKLPLLRQMGFGAAMDETKKDWVVYNQAQQHLFLEKLSQSPQIETLNLVAYPHLPDNLGRLQHLRGFALRSVFSSFVFGVADILQKNAKRASDFIDDCDTHLPADILEKFDTLAQLAQLAQVDILWVYLPFACLARFAKAPHLRIFRIYLTKAIADSPEIATDWSIFKQIRELTFEQANGEIPILLENLPNLEVINLHNLGIRQLNVGKNCPKLHTLRISFTHKGGWRNELEAVHSDFWAVLAQLQTFETNAFVNTHAFKELETFYAICKNTPANVPDLVELMQTNTPIRLPNQKLLEYLHVNLEKIRLQTWAELIARLDKPEQIENLQLHSQKACKYFQIGTPSEPAEFKKLLSGSVWKSCKKLEDADFILIFPQLKTPINIEIPDWKKVLLAPTLTQWLENQQGFERLDETSSLQLLSLLTSPDWANMEVGLDIASKIYRSEIVLDTCVLAIGLFCTEKEIQKKAKNIILKNFPPERLQLFKQHQKNYREEAYELLKNSPLLDTKMFANMAVLITNRAGRSEFGNWDVQKLGGFAMRQAIFSLDTNLTELQAFSILDDPREFDPDFFVQLATASKIGFVNFHNPSLALQEKMYTALTHKTTTIGLYLDQKSAFTVAPNIHKLQQLDHLTLHGENISLPDEFAQLQALSTLNFHDTRAKHIPNVLADCPNLRFCTFKMSDLQDISVFEKGFKHCSRLEIITQQGLNLQPLLRLRALKILSIQTKNACATAWDILEKKAYFPNLEELYLESWLSAAQVQPCLELLCGAGENFKTIKLKFLNAPQLVCNIGHKPKLTYLLLEGDFESIAFSGQAEKLDILRLSSDKIQAFSMNFDDFPNLHYIIFPQNNPFKTALKKSVPKRIGVRFD